ncbi:LytTR family DNA-binding domain-containing protein [Emticicia sp. 21SJ11W-3]|uniref:LytR/AlgR family response regulator transcription factor n=1 Tax=Emticicia sp. 21SJ11W-3 TaxID=2916755 RepID=UPI00209DD28B|nr:LytTR family DNA-binding domain-containing protein [Emticicia sp. 21SJ11W-3]UTA67947.1 LytTR family transcriptional regulator [Emticicia sp. 21SJ11W-3]
MFKILQQPYPFHHKSGKNRFWKSLAEGSGVALFFIIFQPFGLSEWEHPYKIWVLTGFGAIVSICTAIHRFVLPSVFPRVYHEKVWVVWKEIADILLLLALITIANMLYSSFFFSYVPFSVTGFLAMFFIVALIGLIPISFGVMSNYIIQLKKYNQTIIVQAVNATTKEEEKGITLKLIAENEKDVLELKADDLLFIESSDNYSTVVYNQAQTLQKVLLRSSLTRLENQINQPAIVRCHRSYIVNLSKVEKVTGNAQGYKLHLQLFELTIPVARKYSEIVDKLK